MIKKSISLIKNKKGMSLIELSITVVLISFVLLFLYGILLDLNKKDLDQEYSKTNHSKRTEIIKTIQNDIIHNPIYDINTSYATNYAKLEFMMDNNNKFSLEIEKEGELYEIVYTSQTNEISRWHYEDVEINLKDIIICGEPLDYNNSTWGVSIIIFVYTDHHRNNMENNNLLDDIVITYVGDVISTSFDLFACKEGPE